MFLRVRNLALAAAIIVTVYFLFTSFSVGARELETTTRKSLQAITKLTPDAWRSPDAKIIKASTLYGQENQLYDAALRSHDEHDRLNGYKMRLLRQGVVENAWVQPTFLLSLVVEELAKPEEERMEWIMWFGPDVVLLNPHIPLEIFLPPEDFPDVNMLCTRDQKGFNYGVFLLRVHEWSVKFLLEVLATKATPPLQQAKDKSKTAFEMILQSGPFRDHITYQPNTWYNGYQLSPTSSESKPGDLLVHFHDLGGDKWSTMANTIDQVSKTDNAWSVPLDQTTYLSEIDEFWDRLREGRMLLEKAKSRMNEEAVRDAVRRVEYASTYETGFVDVMNDAVAMLKNALGVQQEV